VTVAQGNSANFNVTVTPVNGSTQTVNITCTGAPAFSTCTPAAPGSVTLNGTTASMIQATVTTTKGSFDAPGGFPAGPRQQFPIVILIAASLLTLIASRTRRTRLASLGVILICVTLPGCGTGKRRGTPKGTTNLTVTGTPTTGTAHSATVSLTVN